jgi:hypothetical protein
MRQKAARSGPVREGLAGNARWAGKSAAATYMSSEPSRSSLYSPQGGHAEVQMRQVLLIGILSLATALGASAADKGKCTDASGKTVACPKPSKDDNEVTVTTPLSRPRYEETGPVRPRPDLAMPGMATALCKDGTYSKATQPTAACSIHGGVQQWGR